MEALTRSADMEALLVQLEKSAPALTHTLQRLDELHQTGALDTMLDLAQVVQVAKVSMGDGMVHRLGDLVRVLGELADTAVTSGLPERLPALLHAAEAARVDAATDQRTLGALGLLKALKEPEMQYALKFMVALSRRLPDAAR